jgi:hypothetical protein
MEENDNGMVYVIENKLVLTVEMIDPNNLEYIDIEIGGDKKREYPQTEFKKKKFPELNFEIEVDHRYQNKKDIDIKSADSDGNFNKVNFEPKDDWMADDYDWRLYGNSNRGTSNDNTGTSTSSSRGAYNEYDLTTGTYTYHPDATRLPNKYKEYIGQYVTYYLEELYDDIKANYDDHPHDLYKLKGMETSYLKNHWIDEKWRYAGIALYSILKLFETQDYDNIKNNIDKLGNSYLPENLKDSSLAIMDSLDNDIKTLEYLYGNKEKLMNKLQIIFTRDIQLKLYYNGIFENCIDDSDDDGVPNIIEWGYGTHWKLSYCDGPTNDVDNDGITDYNELKVIFRANNDAFTNSYKSGWVAVNIGGSATELKVCGYADSEGFYLTGTRKGFGNEFIRKGYIHDDEGIRYQYLVFKETTNDIVTVYIIQEFKANGRADVTVFRSNEPVTYYDEGFLPNAIYYLSEKNLCPDAIPIIKDIFIEVDWMWKSKTTNDGMYYKWNNKLFWYDEDHGDKDDKHKMRKGAKDKVTGAFKKHGIALHIDDGSMGGGGPIPHEKKTKFYRDNGDNNDFWDKHKINSFETTIQKGYYNTRQSVFHYCIFAHNAESDDKSTHLGKGEIPYTDKKGIEGADDLIIGDENKLKKNAELLDLYGLSDYYDLFQTLGYLPPVGDADTIQAAIFMHELGHNLNLEYTGGYKLPTNDEGYNPNGHKSCMNYYYILSKVDYTNSEWDAINLKNIEDSRYWKV